MKEITLHILELFMENGERYRRPKNLEDAEEELSKLGLMVQGDGSRGERRYYNLEWFRGPESPFFSVMNRPPSDMRKYVLDVIKRESHV